MEAPPGPGPGARGDGPTPAEVMQKRLEERMRTKRMRSDDGMPLTFEAEGKAAEEALGQRGGVSFQSLEADSGALKNNTERIREAVELNLKTYRPGVALRHLRGFPGFDKAFVEEASWRAGREADMAGKLLREDGPKDLTRQDVLDFSASDYYDTLRDVAPLITSTVTATCSGGTQVNTLIGPNLPLH
jgi:hypothetical protein